MTKSTFNTSINRYGWFRLSNLFLLTYSFLFIYTPLVVLPFNIIHLLSIIAYFFLITKYSGSLLLILKSKKLILFIGLQLAITLFTLLLYVFSNGDFSFTYYATLTIFEVIPIAIYISILLTDRINFRDDFYNFILTIGMIQVVFVVLTLAFPSLRNWIIYNSGSKEFIEVYDFLSFFRIYGLARGYTFSMPLFQGLCIIIAFTLGTYKSMKYFLLIPFYILSIVLNSRIALISIFIVAGIIFLYRFRQHYFKQILSIFFVIIALYLSIMFIKKQAENNLNFDVYDWLYAGVDELTSLNEGEAKGNLAALTDRMWFAPDKEYLLFGTGQNVFGRKYKDSDIGYVVNLYYGGIVFSLLLYLSYYLFILKGIKYDVTDRIIIISVFFYLFIANIKGNVFRPNEIIHGVILLLIFSLTLEKLKVQNNL